MYAFKLPDRSLLGQGAFEAALPELAALGRRPLIVTGPHVARSEMLAKLQTGLESQGCSVQIFSDITGEPTDVMISAGIAAYRAAGCDCLIGIGGGSALDSAKAIAALLVLPGAPADWLGKEIAGDFPPFALIPTTAGTGSEATKFTVISDTATEVKMLLKGDSLLPRLAVVDPMCSVSAPQGITASTGMDALTHAVESYTSRLRNPFTDLYALSAIEKIFRYLPRACADGTDMEAREAMAVAAYEAGVCINNASVTIVHGMSRPIGALFHVPHGLSNAMLIQNCLTFALEGCPERFAAIARRIGAAGPDSSDEAAAAAFLDALGALTRELEIPTPAQYGIDRTEFFARMEKMADDALASGSPGNTIRAVTKDDILEIYRSLW